MANDYQAMQDRIADELDDTALTSQIQAAILSAIKHYSKERWYFTETSTALVTVASTQTVALPSDFKAMDRLRLTYGTTNYWDLTYRPFEYIGQVTSVSTLTGPPQDYALADQLIWLYPIPDAVYTITAYYEQQLTALSSGTDTNAWMVDGEELIRARAKWDLSSNVTQEMEQATIQKQIELEAYGQLRGSNTTRTTQGRITPVYF